MESGRRATTRGLIGLNLALAGLLAIVTFAPGAGAQPQPRRTRPHGQYAMVSCKIQGQTESGIFVVDSANEEMIALRWDRSRKVLSGIGFRDLAGDAQLREKQGR